ncbi:MAG: hypothetical protein ACR5LG_11080 [Sodalis sp. (in: enterobacteria)]
MAKFSVLLQFLRHSVQVSAISQEVNQGAGISDRLAVTRCLAGNPPTK